MNSQRAFVGLFQNQMHSKQLVSMRRLTLGRNVTISQQDIAAANHFRNRSLISSSVTDRSYYGSKRYLVMVTNTKATEDNIISVTTSIKAPTVTSLVNEASLLNYSCSKTEFSSINITNSCWKRIEQLAMRKSQKLEEIYLRVYVDAGGCSGFTYQFEISSEVIDDNEDIIYKHDSTGARVVIDQTSYQLLEGSTIDYVQEMIKSNFSVTNNPQSESACGCGSSFALKNFQTNSSAH